MIRIENVKTFRGDGVYIGRKMPKFPGSPLGNLFKVGMDGTREQVIEKYRHWLRDQWKQGLHGGNDAVRQELLRLAEIAKDGDLHLLCWCSPQKCHGDVIKEVIEILIAKGLL